jgi:hypothetical protein
MNGKLKLMPRCPDCKNPMLPKPVRFQDGCWIRPLHCAKCRCEKDILDVLIVELRADDRFARTAGAS